MLGLHYACLLFADLMSGQSERRRPVAVTKREGQSAAGRKKAHEKAKIHVIAR